MRTIQNSVILWFYPLQNPFEYVRYICLGALVVEQNIVYGDVQRIIQPSLSPLFVTNWRSCAAGEANIITEDADYKGK